MHQPVFVRLVERLGNFAGDLEGTPWRDRPPCQCGLQRLARDVLHDDAGPAVDVGNLVNLADVRMVERRRRASFAVQPLTRRRVALECLCHEFDGDFASELCVVGEEHFAHAAFTQAVEDAVAGGCRTHWSSGFRLQAPWSWEPAPAGSPVAQAFQACEARLKPCPTDV